MCAGMLGIFPTRNKAVSQPACLLAVLSAYANSHSNQLLKVVPTSMHLIVLCVCLCLCVVVLNEEDQCCLATNYVLCKLKSTAQFVGQYNFNAMALLSAPNGGEVCHARVSFETGWASKESCLTQ